MAIPITLSNPLPSIKPVNSINTKSKANYFASPDSAASSVGSSASSFGSGVLGGLAGSILSGIGSLFGAHQQYKYAERAATLAYQRQVEQWNRENEYNRPINQMGRFAEAGLNPNLIYEQNNSAGSLSGVAAADTPDVRLPSFQNIYQDAVRLDLAKEMNAAQIATEQAKASYYNSLSSKNEVETMQKSFDYDRVLELYHKFGYSKQDAERMARQQYMWYLGAQTTALGFQNTFAERTMNYRVQAERAGYTQLLLKNIETKQAIENLKSQKNLTDQQKAYLHQLTLAEQYQNIELEQVASFLWNNRENNFRLMGDKMVAEDYEYLYNKALRKGQLRYLNGFDKLSAGGRAALSVLGMNPYFSWSALPWIQGISSSYRNFSVGYNYGKK